MSPHTSSAQTLSRRRFLTIAGAASAAGIGLLTVPGGALGFVLGPDQKRWSDPAAWGGAVPGAGDVAVVRGNIVLDVNTRVAGVVVEPGSQLLFDDTASRTLESTGNVIVRGTLTMRPSSPSSTHRLAFPTVDERAFVGGGMDPLPTDVGLWVVDAGRLDISGSPRRPWIRAAGAIGAGVTTFELADDPTGWAVGDEVVLTPTHSPSVANHSVLFDQATVAAISGRTVTLSKATSHAHPAVTIAPGRTCTSEVLNLTRNARIEGTAAGRTHVYIRSTEAQRVDYARIQHVGPRQPTGELAITKDVLGRYGLHFHHSMDGSRGSAVTGTVVTQAGAHAFVPHMSDGITFTGCISHDTFDDAYWWDGAADTRTNGHPSNDIVWQDCVASLVKCDPSYRGIRLAGFVLGVGDRNIARGCVATGVQGNVDASGFNWPEVMAGGIWTFEDCISHNNKVHGIFTWQNTDEVHPLRRISSFHNGGAGMAHGAYVNPYRYAESVLYANRTASVLMHANSSKATDGHGAILEGLHCDGAGLHDYAVMVVKHSLAGTTPTVMRNCAFKGYRKAAVGFVYEGANGPSTPELIDFVDCWYEGNEFWLAPGILPASLVRVQDTQRGALALRRVDQPGQVNSAWNASVTTIAPFATSGGGTPPPPTTTSTTTSTSTTVQPTTTTTTSSTTTTQPPGPIKTNRGKPPRK